MNQFGAPPASQFGGAPANPFGAPVNQFGSPTGYAPVAPPGPAKRGMSAGMVGLMAGLSLVLLTALVIGGRFGWRQFGADPVLPDTVAGMQKMGGGAVDDAVRETQAGMGDELVAGSTAKVGMYSDGASRVYLVFAMRGATRSTEDEALTEDWPGSTHGKVQCFTSPAGSSEAAATLCGRTFWRRAVFVMAFGATAPDAATVARATDEVWDAQ